ncbi:MAG: FtsB family cell division protein [Streptosporangiaceae bacterium]
MTARGDGTDRETPASRPARSGGLRPHVTGRAAILAVVLCAIALSLAYPVREYIAQRRQIDRLLAQGDQLSVRLKGLEGQRRQVSNPVFIERLARNRLHMCLATEMCYVVIRPAVAKHQVARGSAEPWYAKLWSSVQQANERPHGRPARPGHHGQPVPHDRRMRPG